MKLYGIVVLAVLYLLVSFGFVLPFLFSAASDVLVIAGVIYLITMPINSYLMYKSAKRMVKKETEIENS